MPLQIIQGEILSPFLILKLRTKYPAQSKRLTMDMKAATRVTVDKLPRFKGKEAIQTSIK